MPSEAGGADGASDEATALYIVVEAGDERYALVASDVIKVVDAGVLNRLPRLPPIFVGITQHRGRIVTAIDLAGAFGQAPWDERMPDGAGQLVVLDLGQANAGLLVEGVFGITALHVAAHAPEGPGPGLRLIHHEGRPLHVVDARALLDALRKTADDASAGPR